MSSDDGGRWNPLPRGSPSEGIYLPDVKVLLDPDPQNHKMGRDLENHLVPFSREEMETQRGQLTCPKPHNYIGGSSLGRLL